VPVAGKEVLRVVVHPAVGPSDLGGGAGLPDVPAASLEVNALLHREVGAVARDGILYARAPGRS